MDVSASTVFTSSELILRRNLEAARSPSLRQSQHPRIEAVTVSGWSYDFTTGEDIFTVVQAKFNYHVVDVFMANQEMAPARKMTRTAPWSPPALPVGQVGHDQWVDR